MAFQSARQEKLFDAVVAELAGIGYRGNLIQPAYRFRDWFLPDSPEREIPAAAFGTTPPSYDSACFGVLPSNGQSGAEWIAKFRALGAPFVFEVKQDQIVQWRMGRSVETTVVHREIPGAQVRRVFAEKEPEWNGQAVMRAKNIVFSAGPRQLDFIDLGLIPALERHVHEKLDPLLRETLANGTKVYAQSQHVQPDPRELFRLTFWLLTSKVLHDRNIEGFRSLSAASDTDQIITRVANYYGEVEPSITDHATRQAIAQTLWGGVDFRNLSVEVLAYIYENTLVDDETRRLQGIHSTPPSIARYVVEHLPFETIEKEDRRVVEPCSGHGIFLVAALQRLRRLLPSDMDPKERHRYFTKMLSGFEIDDFALDVSRLCLMLADFPNPNSWRLEKEDVFDSAKFIAAVQKANIILCNPPYEASLERRKGKMRSTSKPARLLRSVLQHLSPKAVLGFVLPAQFIDGNEYKPIRQKMASRFEQIEVVELPEERVFQHSRMKSALLIAKSPVPANKSVSVLFTKVKDSDLFMNEYAFEWQATESKDIVAASKSLAIFGFEEIWQFLRSFPKLKDAARTHRGVEWQAPFDEGRYISPVEKTGFKRGLHKIAGSANSFEAPQPVYLCDKRQYRLYRAWELPWGKPKVIMNAARVTVGHWKIAAFPDSTGLIATQNFTGVWPRESWTPAALAAVLNGPVASAYVTDAERWKHVTKQTIDQIPLPKLSPGDMNRLDGLVADYQNVSSKRSKSILFLIDALVLSGYGLPPTLEDRLLRFFDGHRRPVKVEFQGYFSEDAPTCSPFSLHAILLRFHLLVDKRLRHTVTTAELEELLDIELRLDNMDEMVEGRSDGWLQSVERRQVAATARLIALEERAKKLGGE